MSTRRRVAGSGPGPWCSVCGRTVHNPRPTFDARHPMGECYYTGDDGETHGHGRVPAITDQVELLDVMARRDRERERLLHRKHDPKAPDRHCRLCLAGTPVARVTDAR